MKFYNFASKKQAINYFVKLGKPIDEVTDLVEVYWKRKNNLDGENKNIDSFLKGDRYEEFKTLVNSVRLSKKEVTKSKRKTLKGDGYVVWENDEYIAWKVNDFESAYELGNWNSTCRKWCITFDKYYWNKYSKHSTFIFLFKKEFETKHNRKKENIPVKLEDKIAIEINFIESYISLWNATDKKVSGNKKTRTLVEELKKNNIIRFTTSEELFNELHSKNIIRTENGNIYDGDFEVIDSLITDGTLGFLKENNIVEIRGTLSIEDSDKLVSLKGCPNIVTNFYCVFNKISSLEGSPQQVKNFSCDSCHLLTSLEGSPQQVEKFICSCCTSLKSLEFCPQKVKEFSCRGCSSLTSLEGSPQQVKYFDCCNCDSLISLSGCPQNILGNFYCNYCRSLTSLEGSPQQVENFDCSGCSSLKNLYGSPQIVENTFSCSCCRSLTSLEGSPQQVKNFKCGDCISLTDLIGCPQQVEEINCGNCYFLKTLKGIPKEVKKLSFYNCNKLRTLEFCPLIISGTLDCWRDNFDLDNFKCDLKFVGEINCKPEVREKIRECIKQNNLTNFSAKIQKYIK